MHSRLPMAEKSNSKTIQGHTRPEKHVQFHKSSKLFQEHFFVLFGALRTLFVPFGTFLLMFPPRQVANNNNNKASFTTFERCSQSKRIADLIKVGQYYSMHGCRDWKYNIRTFLFWKTFLFWDYRLFSLTAVISKR